MKHFFLDTNILLDFLTNREPYAEQAATLFQLSKDGRIKLYVAAISFNNIYYIVRQVQGHLKVIALLKGLGQFVEIIPVDGHILNLALSSDFRDFEDAIQNFSAGSVPEIEAIVTRNLKDFKKSSLAVLLPESAIALLAL